MAAKYRVKSKSFIEDRIVPEGAEIEYAGEPGENLEPLNDEAHAAVAAAAERRNQKAEAIKSALAGTLDTKSAETLQEVLTAVQGFASRLAGVEARVASFEGAKSPDLSAYALQADVAELDAGLTILTGRIDDLEGIAKAIAAPKPAPTAPATPETTAPATPPVEQAAEQTAPPVEQPAEQTTPPVETTG